MIKDMIEKPVHFTKTRPVRVLYGHCLDNRNHPAVRMVHQIAAELCKLGCVVQVHEPEQATPDFIVQPSWTGTHRRKKFQSLRDKLWFAKTILHDRSALKADLEAIREFRPDVVIARHDAYRGSLIRAASKMKIPVIVYADAPVAHETRHWSDLNSPTGRRFHPPFLVEHYEKIHLQMSNAVVTVSEPGRDCLESYGMDCPVEIIRNGVGAEFLGPPLDKIQQKILREQIGLTTPHVAGFVGTFKPFHGMEMLGSLIRAMKKRSDLSWLLVGDGPCKAALMESLGDASAQVVDLGSQPSERLPQLYRLMDIAVAPYQASHQPFHFCPLKILEAQASGAVVVASARGDIPSMIGYGERGIPVYEEGLDHWVDTMDMLLHNPICRNVIARSSLDFIQQNCTWANSAQALLKLVLGLCDEIREKDETQQLAQDGNR